MRTVRMTFGKVPVGAYVVFDSVPDRHYLICKEAYTQERKVLCVQTGRLYTITQTGMEVGVDYPEQVEPVLENTLRHNRRLVDQEMAQQGVNT